MPLTKRPLTETEAAFSGRIKDWRQTDGKQEILAKVWGDEVPDYLYYGIELGQPAGFDTATLNRLFFNEDGDPGFGDIEVGRGKPWTFNGLPYLRIRNGRRVPLVVETNGTTYHLIQIGHASGDPRCVNFFLIANNCDS